MPRGKATDPELVAQVQAALLAGLAVNQVARDFQIPQASVSRIRANLDQGKLDEVGLKTRRRIDDLLEESLQAHLEALRSIAEVGQDKDYLRKQSPDGLSTLHQRLEDHALRLLESAGLADEPGPSTEA